MPLAAPQGPPPKAISARTLRVALLKLGLTQAGLAKLIRVDIRTVRRWAAGDRAPPEAVVILLCLALDGYITLAEIAAARQGRYKH